MYVDPGSDPVGQVRIPPVTMLTPSLIPCHTASHLPALQDTLLRSGSGGGVFLRYRADSIEGAPAGRVFAGAS